MTLYTTLSVHLKGNAVVIIIHVHLYVIIIIMVYHWNLYKLSASPPKSMIYKTYIIILAANDGTFSTNYS